MSPLKKQKLNKIRSELDQLDNSLIKIIGYFNLSIIFVGCLVFDQYKINHISYCEF